MSLPTIDYTRFTWQSGLASRSHTKMLHEEILSEKVIIQIAWQLYSLSRYTLQDRIISGDPSSS
jgi:hypothetical protein